jgi:heptosyltransferase-3
MSTIERTYGRPERTAVLIFQIASMGDTVISMPCYREIARRHPNAQRYLLTNFPVDSKMVAAESILAPTGLITGVLEYSMPLRNFRAVVTVYKQIRRSRPRTLYYLTPEKKLRKLIRHYLFFRLCGIRTIYGMPWRRDLRYPRELPSQGRWESEASRLLRCIGARVEPGPPADADRSLDLTDSEKSTAELALREVLNDAPFIAVSAGGRAPVNDWGDNKWSTILSKLSSENPGLGLLFVGSANERDRNDVLAKCWQGPIFNSCGRFSPRETAALLKRACLFVGHDTGTLHLAAAVGTPVVGIYSARNVPGKWYSDRSSDIFFYNKVECFGCECFEVAECSRDRECIAAISADQVAAAVRTKLALSS